MAMQVQFLVEANRRNLRTLQRLPALFTERLLPKHGWVYLIHNLGTKHKVSVKMDGGTLKLFEREWRAFLDDSRYSDIATFHFIRQEEDTYYVTAYNNDGHELNGYNLSLVGYRQRRFLATLEQLQESPPIPTGFLTNTMDPEFRIHVSGMLVSTVTHRQIELVDEGRNFNVFGGQGWNVLVHAEKLVVGTRVVFTNLLNNQIQMMPFGTNGWEMRHDRVERMILNWRRPFVKSPIDDDKRLQHICQWEGHTEHDNEVDCFYAPILAYVTDRSRLNIPHEFVKARQMWQYHNAILKHNEDSEFYVDLDVEYHSDRPHSKNHVTIKCRWRNVVLLCGWEPNKMVRFTMVDRVPDKHASLPSKPVLIPVFHMC